MKSLETLMGPKIRLFRGRYGYIMDIEAQAV